MEPFPRTRIPDNSLPSCQDRKFVCLNNPTPSFRVSSQAYEHLHSWVIGNGRETPFGLCTLTPVDLKTVVIIGLANQRVPVEPCPGNDGT